MERLSRPARVTRMWRAGMMERGLGRLRFRESRGRRCVKRTPTRRLAWLAKLVGREREVDSGMHRRERM
jgi:hypothetical protein